MIQSIGLPSPYDILAVPPLAPLAILEVALSMSVSAIHCEHVDLDEIPRYIVEGSHPPKSLVIAQAICLRADELSRIIATYRAAAASEINSIKSPADLPF
jgi:hypothetical protein